MGNEDPYGLLRDWVSAHSPRSPRKDYRSRFYYHVHPDDDEDWGDCVELEPLDNASMLLRAPAEPDFPRIVVAPTVEQCLVSRYWEKGELHVYCTAARVQAYYPLGIEDVGVTGEKWLLNATQFVRQEKIFAFDPIWELLAGELDHYGHPDGIPQQKALLAKLRVQREPKR
jgi:hypothetical protein